MGIMENKCCRCKKLQCDWLKHQTSVVFVLECPCFEEKGEEMPGFGNQSELQNLYGKQEKDGLRECTPSGKNSIL